MSRQALKLRVKLCEFAALGPGKVDLLEAIARCGSITAAAKDQGMSYRRAWLLVDEMNRALKDPVIEASFGGTKGGGARLTATGLAIIDIYRRVQHKAEQAIRLELDELDRLLADDPKPSADRTVRRRCEAQGRRRAE